MSGRLRRHSCSAPTSSSCAPAGLHVFPGAALSVCCASRALRSCGRVLRCEGVRGVRLVSSGSCSSTPLLRWGLCAPVRRVLRMLRAALVYLVESDAYLVQRLACGTCCVLRWHAASAGGFGVCEGAGARSPAAAGSGSTALRLPLELCAPSELYAPFYCGRGCALLRHCRSELLRRRASRLLTDALFCLQRVGSAPTCVDEL